MRINFRDLLDQIVAEGGDVSSSGPVPDEKIDDAQKILQVSFPPSYREYLAEFGALEIDGQTFAGLTANPAGSLGDVVAFTQYFRAEYHLPTHFIALDFQDGDYFLCMDSSVQSDTGESPLFLIDPVKLTVKGHKVADTFTDYLAGYLAGYLND